MAAGLQRKSFCEVRNKRLECKAPEIIGTGGTKVYFLGIAHSPKFSLISVLIILRYVS